MRRPLIDVLDWQEQKQTFEVYSHHGTAEETDTNHEHPARDGTESPDHVTHRDAELVLRNPAINGVESTLVGGELLVVLLGVNLVDSLGGDGGSVQVQVVERSGGALLASGLLLGKLVVHDGGSAGRPGGAEHLVRLAVQITEVRRIRIG